MIVSGATQSRPVGPIEISPALPALGDRCLKNLVPEGRAADWLVPPGLKAGGARLPRTSVLGYFGYGPTGLLRGANAMTMTQRCQDIHHGGTETRSEIPSEISVTPG